MAVVSAVNLYTVKKVRIKFQSRESSPGSLWIKWANPVVVIPPSGANFYISLSDWYFLLLNFVKRFTTLITFPRISKSSTEASSVIGL